MSDGTVIDELLVALRHVEDLDGLQYLVGTNETVQQLTPSLATWLTLLCNAERNRRETHGEDDYPMPAFEDWPARLLVENAFISLSIIEAAIISGAPPAIMQFVLRLVQLLVGLVGHTLILVTEACPE
jgi:hypothetical protein